MSLNFTFSMDIFALTAARAALEAQGCSFATVNKLGAQPLDLRAMGADLTASMAALEPSLMAQFGGTAMNGAKADLVAARALHQALAASPLGLVTADLHAAAMVTAESRLQAARASFGAGDVARAKALAGEARGLIAHAATETFDRLRVTTNMRAARDLQAAVADLGFETQVAERADGTHAIWARQGDQVIAAVVSGTGAVEVDMVGWEGTRCVAAKNALQERLRARGWTVTQFAEVLHQRRGGGALITETARVARERDCAPEEALLATTTRAARGEPSSTERMRRALFARRAAVNRAR